MCVYVIVLFVCMCLCSFFGVYMCGCLVCARVCVCGLFVCACLLCVYYVCAFWPLCCVCVSFLCGV